MGLVEAEEEARGWSLRSFASWTGRMARLHVTEYGGTFATEFTVLASQLLVYKLAAHFLGRSGFSEYAVARRTISLIYPLPLLGIAIALPRYVAHAVGTGNGVRSAKYFGAAVWCMGIGLLVSVLLMNSFPGMFAYTFFAGREYANLVFPLSVLLIGLVLHTLVYSYFRGRLEMRRANLLQLINYGIVPPAAFVAFHNNVRSVLSALGILTTVVACVGLALTPLRQASVHVVTEAKELLRYGLQRVPGDFVQMAIFTLPVTFVAHFNGMQKAGYVAFGVSVLNMMCSVFSPIGLILLPKASRMFAEQSCEEANQHISQISRLTILVSLFITVVLAALAEPLMRIYLGQGYEQVAGTVRLVVCGGVPFCLFYVQRSVVDAFHENGINTRNLVLAFTTLVLLVSAGLPLGGGLLWVLISLTVSLYCLGVLTALEVRRILKGIAHLEENIIPDTLQGNV